MKRLGLCTLLGLAGLGPGSPASAAVSIGPERIEVSDPGARAVVTRSPFRLEFQDGAGQRIVRQVANDRAAPFFVAGPQPEPFSTGHFRRPALYAPLSFTVGASRTVQPCPGNVCGGNQLAGFDAGTEYTARDVLSAAPEGEGVKLTVSTNDPSGRTLVVTITPGPGRAIRTRVVPTPAEGVTLMADSFESRPGEAFRGFGGRHNAIDQRGESFYTWPEQENSSNEGGSGVSGRDDYQFPNGPHAAYYPQALFYSSEPYGFLLNQTHLSFFRMASEREDAWNVSVVGDELDYIVAPGEARQAIATITAINGRHRMPPEWSMGAMTTNWRPFAKAEKLSSGVDTYERAVREDIAMIKKHGVPIESYDLFGWAFFDQATLKSIMDEFRKLDIRVLSYFQAFVDDNTHGFSEAGMYEEAIQKGYAVKTAAGTPYIISSPLLAGLAVMVDFTNPAAVEWWKRRIHRNLDLGFDGFMEDFGEQISLDMHFHNGETGATMHNKYPNLYHAATRAAIEEYERTHPGREIWNYTRSGYSGTTEVPGSAWGEIANFPGDNTADWTQASGLRSAAVDMLSRGVGGAWGFSTDIGGYLGDTPKELFYRWTQWAALSPYFRLHNSSSNGTRQPWFYDEGPTVAMFKHYVDLHHRAGPLILRLAREAERTGIPVARPFWLEFPGDEQAARQEQQWMLGPDVLVAPVVEEGARARSVYFPRGCWESPETDERFNGPRAAEVDAPLGRLPYFFRCGTNPFAAAAGRRGCLARRSPIGPRNIGRIRIGHTRRRLLRLPVRPLRRTRRAFAYCVKGQRGRVSAVFSRPGRRGRVRLVTTTAPAHGNRGVRPGARTRRLRAYPRRLRLGPVSTGRRGGASALFRSFPASPRLIGVRRGRVRFIAVADRRLLRSPRALPRYLGAARVR